MEVTGFSLICICHNFARRGRAFVRSLAAQVGAPPLNLYVYFANHSDETMLWQGIIDQGSVKLATIKVPESEILNRSKWFRNCCDKSHQLQGSHVIFTDCDLWFPSGFFKEYAAALEEVESGYWSAMVLQIDEQSAQKQLQTWDKITARSLRDEMVDRGGLAPRHPQAKGSVGHFQCIPAGFHEYPEKIGNSVAGPDGEFAYQCRAKMKDRRHERRIGSAAFHLGHPERMWNGTNGLQL